MCRRRCNIRNAENKLRKKTKQSKYAQPIVGMLYDPSIQCTFVVCVQTQRPEEMIV